MTRRPLSSLERLEQTADAFILACDAVVHDPHPSRFGDVVVPDVYQLTGVDALAALRRLAQGCDRSFGDWTRQSAVVTYTPPQEDSDATSRTQAV